MFALTGYAEVHKNNLLIQSAVIDEGFLVVVMRHGCGFTYEEGINNKFINEEEILGN